MLALFASWRNRIAVLRSSSRRAIEGRRSSPARGRETSAGIAAALVLGLGAFAGCSDSAPRSVILITIDTCRADQLDPDAERSVRTPNIDRFCAQGRRYARAFSASAATAPSHASMLTGLYPSWHSVGLYNGRYSLDAEPVPLAERLRAKGIRTGAVVSNPVLRRSVGWDRGFESYDDALEDREAVRRTPERRASTAVDHALAWLDERAGDPFFLWLHLQDPHGPYTPAEVRAPLDSASGASLPIGEDHSGFRAIPRYQELPGERATAVYRHRYGGEVEGIDRALAPLFDRLRSDPDLAETLTILTADHGESMGEDEFWFAHGHSVGLDQVHVPLVLVGPGIASGELRTEPVSNVAVFATCLEFLDAPNSTTPQAPSLLSSGAGEPVFVETLNQAGIATDRGFLRRDRVAASEIAFWMAGNPISQGFWKPLGEEVVPFAAADAEGDWVDRSRATLDEHERGAARAREALAARRSGVSIDGRERALLKSLGYSE